MKSLQELAKDAMQVQDACNLSGVVFAFADVMRDLCEHFRDAGTDYRNQHPIAVMWSSKIASLTRSEDCSTMSKAYDWCHAAQKGEVKPWEPTQ